MTKKSRILAGVSTGVFAFGAAALAVTPTFAATDGWQQITVTTSQELVLTGGLSTDTTLSPLANGGADSQTAGSLGVRANVDWKLQWQAVEDDYLTESTTAASGTFLTATGFDVTAPNAAIAYQGTNAVASGANVWSAQLAATGSGQTLAFAALTPALGTIWTGSSTVNAELTPTYSADIDATLNNGTYFGTIYYTLSAN